MTREHLKQQQRKRRGARGGRRRAREEVEVDVVVEVEATTTRTTTTRSTALTTSTIQEQLRSLASLCCISGTRRASRSSREPRGASIYAFSFFNSSPLREKTFLFPFCTRD